MQINFNVTGSERKRLVAAMGDILGSKPNYLGAPSFAYEVDYFTIDTNGTVSFDDRADSEKFKNLVERLQEKGFADGSNPEAVKAYTHFVSALYDMARNQKRVTAKEKETDNDKYAFRCFLLRLGFIGEDYKAERKILLRNLSGSSAFKSPKGGADDE